MPVSTKSIVTDVNSRVFMVYRSCVNLTYFDHLDSAGESAPRSKVSVHNDAVSYRVMAVLKGDCDISSDCKKYAVRLYVSSPPTSGLNRIR